MKLIITNCFFLFVLCTRSLSAQDDHANFTTLAATSPIPAILQFTCKMNNDRVSLSWITDNNESADRFELERSKDGKNFHTAALVFGTDKTGADNYGFFEKAKTKKLFYRIRIIQKDHSIVYSSILEVKENK